jgi:hypothetical protein
MILAGLAGGFIGNGVLGVLFSSPPVRAVLYHPEWQSQLFLQVTPERNMTVSVSGLIILSVIHSWLFDLLRPSIPGETWVKKGLFWGATIWLMYWVFQEWFIYHTLLAEPIVLAAFELVILLVGSLAEGLVIAFILMPERRAAASTRKLSAAPKRV